VRPPTPDDLDAVFAVVAAQDIADLGEVGFAPGELRDEWSRPGFDLSTDAVVVEAEDRIVAAAWMRKRQAFVSVDPAFTGHGIGAELLAWAERRAVELGRDVHRQEVGGAPARALLEQAGYGYVTSFWRMEIGLAAPPPEPAWPAGVRVRHPVVPDDGPALHAIDEAAFVTVPSYHPEPVDEFVAGHLHVSDLALDLSTLAEDDEGPAGFTLCRRWTEEDHGYVDLLAVHPRAAGRGIGTALLRQAFADVRADGLGAVALGVDAANPRALGVYERAGMRRGARIDRYERPAG
jgi:ribosomal protein S18 acetylase RimI-like enzyme